MLRPQRTAVAGKSDVEALARYLGFRCETSLDALKSGIDLRLNLLFELVDALANMFLLLLWRSF